MERSGVKTLVEKFESKKGFEHGFGEDLNDLVYRKLVFSDLEEYRR